MSKKKHVEHFDRYLKKSIRPSLLKSLHIDPLNIFDKFDLKGKQPKSRDTKQGHVFNHTCNRFSEK